MTNKSKLLFRLSLQFFADQQADAPVMQDTGTSQTGDASPANESDGNESSAETYLTGNQIEEEFEKLIKGGKYESAFKKRTQSIIDKRFKTLKSLEETQAKQQPVLDFLSEKYGIDSSDPKLLLQKMQEDHEKTSNNPKEDAAKPEHKLKESLIAEKAQALSRRWTEESIALKKAFPDFNLQTELKNPAFASLLKSGLPIAKAYTAVHSDRLIKEAVEGTAKRVAEQTLKSIRAQGNRVAENGLHNGASFVRKTDIASLTGEEIRNIVKQVENGSKIRF